MTDSRMTKEEWLGHLLDTDGGDFVRAAVKQVAEAVMEMQVSQLAGAQLYERAESRADHRNGYRERSWDTRAGTIELRVPKLRRQGYQPSFLEPRTRAEKALFAVVQEAYVKGVSTRKVEALVQAMGVASMDKSRVSRMCSELDELVEQWRGRELSQPCPYLMVDAKYVNVRSGGVVVSKALVVAFAVQADGKRSILGTDLFELESTATWRSFLRSLVERGLRGVKLVVSDDHLGLRAAIKEVFTGAAWQRCTVHFMRNMEGHVKRSDRDAVKTVIRSVLRQETKEAARKRLREAVEALGTTKVGRLLEAAEEELLAHMSFPTAHWTKLRSTNPLERVNKEIARRADVVGIFPTDRSVLRLVGALLMEQDEEWMLARRYLSMGSLKRVLAEGNKPNLIEEAA